MDITYAFAGLLVSDRDSSAGWYARVFGRPADMLPNDAEASWQVTGSASLYLLADSKRAGHGIFTLMVGDLDQEISVIEARGVDAGPVEAVPGGAGRRCVLTDPDGNEVQVVELAT